MQSGAGETEGCDEGSRSAYALAGLSPQGRGAVQVKVLGFQWKNLMARGELSSSPLLSS